MDQNSTNALAYCGFVVSTGVAILGAMNHKRIRSNCCGKVLSASLDVENTTPPENKKPDLVIKVPEEK
jgi:hypothetical protein